MGQDISLNVSTVQIFMLLLFLEPIKEILYSSQEYTPQNDNFQMQRHHFPVKLGFDFTIHKFQDQTLSKVCIYLKKIAGFSHEQLYVAMSRIGNPIGI